MKEYDASGDGQLDFDEFCDLVERQTSGDVSETQLIRESFKMLAGGADTVTLAALKAALLEAKVAASPGDVDRMFNEAGGAGGALDLASFRFVWKQVYG